MWLEKKKKVFVTGTAQERRLKLKNMPQNLCFEVDFEGSESMFFNFNRLSRAVPVTKRFFLFSSHISIDRIGSDVELYLTSGRMLKNRLKRLKRLKKAETMMDGCI